ncbi:MAG: hypothetical protein Q7T57_03245 [Dehalococcoidales bacterium]|nr:hypothetical protein [Dehalococcoidales bacterium]
MPTEKRAVGRPKRTLHANDVLAAAAAANDNAEPVMKKQKTVTRGEYTDWFSSPHIHQILREYKRCLYRARATVSKLKAEAPDDRFARLTHTTLIGWHDDKEKHKLKPQYQAYLESGLENIRQNGPLRAFEEHPAIEEEIKQTLLLMRSAGTAVNSHVIRWVMDGIIALRAPPDSPLTSMNFSKSFVCAWARKVLTWSWRKSTTAASKLPLDWEDQGVLMAKRIAATMETHDVHPSLVINMDQTGVHLVPTSNWTYQARGSKSVAVVGAEDKRQITVCIASSLEGDLLPPQLIFQGKTPRSLPSLTVDARAAKADVTFSENHWSNQTTMRDYIEKIVIPYAESRIQLFKLDADAKIILVLDVWSVHKSEEFRFYLRTQHPRIHLVFVPANCTSKLQVADVVLQRPFKHVITQRFNEWASEVVLNQIAEGKIIGLNDSLKMSTIKPLALDWCIESWKSLKERKSLIIEGWKKCVTDLYNVNNPEKRIEALKCIVKEKLDIAYVPEEEEQDEEESAHEEDSDEDELDITKPRVFGMQGARERTPAKQFGYQLASSAICMTDDSSTD